MKIIISANTSWYLYNFRLNTIKELIRDGHSVIAIAPKDEYSEKLSAVGCSWLNIKIDQSGTNPFYDCYSFVGFLLLYKRLKPDVVLNFTPKNNIYSTLAASLFNIKCINNIAGLGKLFSESSVPSLIARLLYKFTQKKASKVFFQNEEDRQLFLDQNIVQFEKTERLFGSGIDLERFSFSNRKFDSHIKFLLVARLLKQKGIYEYAYAARELKRKYGDLVEFQLLGFLEDEKPDSVNREDLDHWIKDGVINFLGKSDRVEDKIASVDCMVLPSFYREGVPKSLLEGLASGKPIITTNNVGCKETVIDGVNGFLCTPKDGDSLLSKIDLFIQLSIEQKKSFAVESRKLAESKFDEKIVIAKYLKAIDEAVNRV